MTGPTDPPEQPWPVRTVARKIAEWVDRLGAVWVEGQLAQVTARAGTGTAFLVLRDPAADVSLQLTAPIGLVREGGPAVAEGNRVVVHGKPSFFLGRGTLCLRVDEIRAVGIGELLARIERLRRLLAAEGLFDPARKRRLPFLPGCIGLVTGRASAAEHDVVSNAPARWPAVRFRIENTAVQGALAVPQIVDALRRAGPRPGRRRDRAGPRRRQRRGPAAVLRRDAVPGGRRLPHAGGVGDRARAGHPAGRPRRRPALLHPDRGRPAGGARPGRGDRPDRRAARPGPARAGTAGWTASSGCSRAARPAGAGRPAARPGPRADGGRPAAADRRAGACCAGWTGAAPTSSTSGPAGRPRPGRDPGPRVRGGAAGHRRRRGRSGAALGRRGGRPATRLRVRVGRRRAGRRGRRRPPTAARPERVRRRASTP